jgi:hypothetical protein
VPVKACRSAAWPIWKPARSRTREGGGRMDMEGL